MGFRQLVNNGADRTAIQTYLAMGNMLTTTIRKPENLKDTIAEEGLLPSTNVSACIRQYAISQLVNRTDEAR